MHFLWASIRKELKRRFNDPWALFMWLAIPATFGLLMSTVMGGGGPRIRALLLVSDLDDSFISQTLPAAFSGGQLADMVEVREIGEIEGKALMEEGGASAHLVIPEGFGDDYLNRRPVDISLSVNPAQRISPRLVRDVLESFLDLGNYLHLVLGDELKAITALDDADDLLSEVTALISADISRKITKVGPFLFPPKIEIVDRTPVPEGRPVSDLLLMFPGVLIMAVFFAGNGMASNYWTEREKGTLGRWLVSPNHMGIFWAGQFVSAMLLLGLVALPILIGGFFYVGIPFEMLIPSLLWLMLAGPLLFAFLMLVQVSAATSNSADVIATLLMFPLLMVGGSFFPTEAMPEWLAPVADFTPNGRILEPLKQYFIGTFGASGLLEALAPVLAATIVLIVLAWLVVRRRLTN
ncbi:MAG: ABC transporter permease [Proteobacteria bacterium]|nr:ABC transporter permease [Pseudomonadota bacterium]